jgi:hypothetical protein
MKTFFHQREAELSIISINGLFLLGFPTQRTGGEDYCFYSGFFSSSSSSSSTSSLANNVINQNPFLRTFYWQLSIK